MATRLGKAYLVGTGPGDADLLTLKGKKCLEQAHVILYDQW
jgi:siroheme synthase